MITKLTLLKLLAYLFYAFAAIALVFGLNGSPDAPSNNFWTGLLRLLSLAVMGLVLDVFADIGINVLDIKQKQEEMDARIADTLPID